MKNLIKKLFNSRQKNELTHISFEKLKVESEVVKIFRAISKYSKNSEIRYVGGCVRKILNNEKCRSNYIFSSIYSGFYPNTGFSVNGKYVKDMIYIGDFYKEKLDFLN